MKTCYAVLQRNRLASAFRCMPCKVPGSGMKVGMDKEAGEEKKQGDGLKKAGAAIALGTNLAAGMAVFSLAGYWIDRKRGGGIFWTVCGMFLGLLYGAYEVWKAIRLMNPGDRERKDAKEQPGGS